MAKLHFTHPYIDKFPGDDTINPIQRQTPNAMYARVKPIGFPNAELIATNNNLLQNFGIIQPPNALVDELLNANPSDDLRTYATAYAGHQFGNWAGQLGDGRAIYLGEIMDTHGREWEWQYKGAGATPYSRRGDGRAVLRSTIREFLMSEAMFHLNIPTTRSISLSLSGEMIMRDIMYDGNANYEKGAVMIRAAESFLRFGHFEFLTANDNIDLLRKLADYVIERYYPTINSKGKERYLDLYQQIQHQTIDLMIEWYRVGFVHGVMNTDNMSILGLTIDYGPFAMLDDYQLNFTSNTTDLPGRRYAFGKQGNIALWNLNVLANAFFPLINDAEALENILSAYEAEFWTKFDAMIAKKFGIDYMDDKDAKRIQEWQTLMLKLQLDYTLFFSELKNFNLDKSYQINLESISYKSINADDIKLLNQFTNQYKARLMKNKISQKKSFQLMKENNPEFILRNYLLFEATQDAETDNYDKFFKLWDALRTPYENKYPEYRQKRPEWANGVPGCSMLSCSS